VPDAGLLDIGLPEMDGNELARGCARSRVHGAALLMAMTGYGQEQDRRAALEAGFDHHLVKPVAC
jgi:CheY-like chemotaxis protein